MAQEVGVAYVTLLPSGKGFGKAVEGQVDDALGKSEKKTDGFFSKLGKGVKNVALGVAAVATGVAALAVSGGISRALNIEDAQAKLKGLGHDTQSVEAIMSNALASVKGTAFGLDEAATMAATAVAAGIKPGKDLERYLRLTADAATIAGGSMADLGNVMNNVTTLGAAYNDSLQILAQKGLPIYEWLAEEIGATTAEVKNLASEGKISAETFRAAIENNISGAALEAGNTTRGAFKNMMAALSRLGLVFVEDGVAGAKTFFNEVTVILDGIAERVKPWVASINEALGGAFTLDGFGDRFLAGFDRLVSAIASGPIPQLLSALQPVLPVILEVAQVIGGALGEAFREVGEALSPILPEIAQTLADAVVQLAPSLADLLVAVLPLVPSLVELLAALIPIATAIISFVLPALQWLIELVAGNWELTSRFFDLLSGDTSLAGFAVSLFSIGGPIGAVIGWLSGLMDTFRNWAMNVGFAVGAAVGYMSSLPGRILSAVASLPGLLVGVGRDMIQGLINGVSSMVSQAVAAVKNVGGQMLNGVKSFLGIRSPSRVFRDQVGKMVGLGLLEGLGDQAINGRIDTAVNHLVQVPDGAAAGSGSGNRIRVEQRIMTPDPRIAAREAAELLRGGVLFENHDQ